MSFFHAHDEIQVCPNHMDKELTPLIWTFAFIGSEYWCPACGYNSGMLGAGKDVKRTKVLENRLARYKVKSKKFLHATGLLVCSHFIYKGKSKKFNEMSQRFKTYWINQSKKWKYKYA